MDYMVGLLLTKNRNCIDFRPSRGLYRLRVALSVSIAGILGLLISEVIPGNTPSPLYAQFMQLPSSPAPALPGFPPSSSIFSDNTLVPMCLQTSLSYIPISSIGMINCPLSTIPVVVVTNPLTFSGTSSNLISVCTYTINSEFDFFGFDLTPTITLTNCVSFSSQLPPVATDTTISTATTTFPSMFIPTTTFP